LVNYLIKPKLSNIWLFIASFFFYAWGGLKFALIVLFSTVINYILGLYLDKCKKNRLRLLILIFGVSFNLGILVFFKYFNFITDNINGLIRIFNPDFNLVVPNIPLPIGISFFTFQIMSYIIDVYRKAISAQKSIVNLSLYVFLFPQLIAGPIVRYIDIETQIVDRMVDLNKFNSGLYRFTIGLIKKVIIANNMALVADFAFNNYNKLNTPIAWFGIVCYALQIYFDFSAYSDMAIGMGKMLGFDFLENFNYPYISKSIKEFWRRWHISLSTWFKDYVYIPLGGSKKGNYKTYRNLIIIFLLTGFWHGASWNFVIWGLFNGIFLLIERIGFEKILMKIPRTLQHIYALLVVLFGWVFFRAADLESAINYLKQLALFNFDGSEAILEIINLEIIVTLVLALIFSTPFAKYLNDKINKTFKNFNVIHGFKEIGICLMFILAICYVIGAKFNPFIYFIF